MTVAGTEIAISAAAPYTFDRGGYAALAFTPIGEITDGGQHGRTYAEVTHNPINSRATQKFKGSFNEGTKTLQLAISDQDEGQVLVRTALNSDAPYSFRVTYQDGAVDYFQALVLGFETSTASVDSMRSGSVNLSITTTRSGVGIIGVRATDPLPPQSLFVHSEQGAVYDPSDLATMFQDSGGATPVTGVGQPVGLILDKRLGLVRGIELAANGNFADGLNGWVAGSSVTAAVVSGEVQIAFAATGFSLAANRFALKQQVVAGEYFEIAFDATYVSGGGSLQVGVYNTQAMSVASADNGGTKKRYSCIGVSPTLSNVTDGAATFGASVAGAKWNIDNVSVRLLPGNHASQSVAAARPLLERDEFGYYRLAFDGIDDYLKTNDIDFSATDKVTAWTGARKLDDAVGTQIIVELGTNTGTVNGTFGLVAANAASPNFLWRSRGQVNYSSCSQTGLPSPMTVVMSASGQTANNIASSQINGARFLNQASVQGGGAYIKAPLYIGARAGTGSRLQGHIYALVIRGTASNAAQIAGIEHYVNSKTGAF